MHGVSFDFPRDDHDPRPITVAQQRADRDVFFST